jgi:beta-glucosidase
VAQDFMGKGKPGQTFSVDYDVEGSDIGYRWFARNGTKPAFAFGHGLSYTSFAHSGLKVTNGSSVSASFTVKNSGARDGADVPQLYLVNQAGKAMKRLAAFSKIALKAGESKTVSVTVDQRLLANFVGHEWLITAGSYGFALGHSADDLGPVATVTLAEKHIKP